MGRYTYGIIGMGRMGNYLATMLTQKGERAMIGNRYGSLAGSAELASISDVLLITVPPNAMKELANMIKPYIRDDLYIISTDTQTSFDYIAHLFGRTHRISRASPTPYWGKCVRTPYLANYDGVTDTVMTNLFGSRSVLRVADERTFQAITDFIQKAPMDIARSTLNLIHDGRDPQIVMDEMLLHNPKEVDE